jgi:ribonuclease T1
MSPRIFIRPAILILLTFLILPIKAFSDPCEKVVHELNARLSPTIDERELVDVLRTLNSTNNKKLPTKFVTKREAKEQGWRPGRDLWSVPALSRASIGGDKFRNREDRLPGRSWREADLDYRGGHRGSKRLIFSGDGGRFVTVDHYRTFVEVPACR